MELRRLMYDECMPSAPLPQAPQLGLLTRTVVHSPVVKWMFPARIRHEDKNDVIFVRESTLELKQLVRDRMRTVASKCDFDATIRAARILGEPRRLVSTPNESESDFEDDEYGDEVDRGSDVDTMDIDIQPRRTLPPQIIALALRSLHDTKLMFLFAQDSPCGGVDFVSSTFPLPSHENSAGRPDAHIAVDPRSLAMAVAAQNDVVVLYALKARDQLAAEVEQHYGSERESFNPVKEQFQIELSATVLKMEFLHPPKDLALQGVVFLALVLSVSGQTRIRLFEWDSSQSLREIRDIWDGGYPIPHDVRHLPPSQLITIANNCGLILTYEGYMLSYQNLHNAYSAPMRIDYPKDDLTSNKKRPQKIEAPYEFGNATRARYWTAWARPARTEAFRETNDCLYLGREDGVLSFMNFSGGDYDRHEIGKVKIGIDSGFASLDPGGTRAMAQPLQQKLYNWSPVLDWAIIPFDSSSSLYQPGVSDIGRIFACAGYGSKHGQLCEIRRGIEAQCLLDSPLRKLGVGRPTRLWLLDTGSQSEDTQYSALVLSDPGGKTAKIMINGRNDCEEDATDEFLDELLDTESETIAAAVTADQLAVQITTSAIRVLSVHKMAEERVLATQNCPSRIVQACIDGKTSTCLLCLNEPDGHRIHHLSLEQGEEAPRIKMLGSLEQNELSAGVACLSLLSIAQISMVLIGTVDQRLVLYRADEVGMTRVATYEFEGQSAICESVGHLRPTGSRSSAKGAMLLCGLRNGRLHVLRLNHQDVTPLTLHQELHVGYSTVSVFPERSSDPTRNCSPRSAIIVCQDVLLRLSVSGDATTRCNLHRIWPSQVPSRGNVQSSIFAVGQFQSWLGRHRLSRALCYVDEDALRIVSIDTSRITGPVPRRIKLDGTPRRVIFAKSVERLVVAHEELVMLPSRTGAADRSTNGKQLVFSKVRIVHPEQSFFESAPHDEVAVGLSGDRITGMLEWMPEMNGSRWSLLVVSTIRKRDREGCIYLYRLRDQNGKCSLKLQKEIPRGEPVHSIATFGETGLVYGCGRRLEIVQLASSDKGLTWVQPQHLQLELDSPARALSTHGNEIYTSTALHSHLVCTLINGKLAVRYNDYKARHGMDNLYLNHGSRLLLGSDAHGGVCGLWRPEEDLEERNMRPVFEARLLTPIIRLQLGTIRSASRHESYPTALGVAMSGSFHSFDILETQRWRLLRFVQNLIDRDPRICPATYMDNENRHIEPATGPSHMHVDGNILARLFEQSPSGAAFVRSLLELPPKRTREYDFENATQRMERFQELVRDAFTERNVTDPCSQFMAYLHEIIKPAQ